MRGRRYASVLTALLLLLAWGGAASGQTPQPTASPGGDQAQTNPGDPARGGSLGGPASVPSQIAEDGARRRITLGEFLRRRYGVSVGLDYNVLPQQVSKSPGETTAAGGVVRLYGSWKPFHRDADATGSVVFKVEHRHTLGTSIPPQGLGPTAGLASITATAWSDAGALLTNLYWSQSFADNRAAIVAGVVDVTDYVDLFGLINIWTDFSNLAFSTNPSMAAPNQGLGAAARWSITPNVYVLGGIADANGNPHRPDRAFSSFFGDAEFFAHAEIGWAGSWGQRFSDNIHATIWHADPRVDAGVDAGWGTTVSLSRSLGSWMPFVRAGFSDGGGALVDRTVSAGVGRRLTRRTDDYAGIGVNWGRPPAGAAGTSPRDQYTIESYYRAQFMPELAIVPSVQFFIHPAWDPTRDHLWLLGVKVRLAI